MHTLHLLGPGQATGALSLLGRRDHGRVRASDPLLVHPSAEPSHSRLDSGGSAHGASLEAANAQWRVAFNASEDALAAAGRCGASLRFPGGELGRRRTGLARERAATARLLDEIAREERVVVYRRLSAPRATKRTLGLPPELEACIFDLDGVLTPSGALHAEAWAETFDALLARRVERTGERFAPFRPFDPQVDYFSHISGRPRLEGVHAFLASRGIRLPEGRPEDTPDAETVHGLANRKKEILLEKLERDGVKAFAGAHGYLESVREAGLHSAVVSASANTEEILEQAQLAALVDCRIDGNTMLGRGLRPKPAPDTLLQACAELGVIPGHAGAFEPTTAGVTAAHAAGLGLIIAVDRSGRAAALVAHGADRVVPDLVALLEPEALRPAP
jgi:beta-phosphoglucomutase-like phosphatase (HAD superfamily)